MVRVVVIKLVDCTEVMNQEKTDQDVAWNIAEGSDERDAVSYV